MITHGFELEREQFVPELRTQARLYRHVKTGARLLSLSNDDENKSFAITFRTPISDSTGVPHILEHSVLCGSRKYPTKEPFTELLRGSLKTFLNAMTYPDKTVYPVASQNLKDFYNLVDVYLDAVFYPLIPPTTLQQEGWHYELENPDDPLIYKGVVFNEMKGSYAAAETVLGDAIQQALFPDTTYAHDAGGDPRHIPDLTYEQFKAYHTTLYHPSNSYIYFYGDDDPTERLRYMDGWLSQFERQAVDSAVTDQPRFDAPRRVVKHYAVEDDTDTSKKSYVTLNWMMGDVQDPEHSLGMQILSGILVGMQASPLRRALIDSGLGEELTGTGFNDEIRQMNFSTGLKGVAPEDVDRVETLILDTLKTLARDGIDPDTVQAAINSTEFDLRENNTGGFPRGLGLLFWFLNAWVQDGDPLAHIGFEAPLAGIKARLGSPPPAPHLRGEGGQTEPNPPSSFAGKGDGGLGSPGYFESLIQTWLVDNPHRVTVILHPDAELNAKYDAEERARLDAARAQMTPGDIERIIADTQHLKELQNTPDSPEALATIPSLRRSDLDRFNKTVPLEVQYLARSSPPRPNAPRPTSGGRMAALASSEEGRGASLSSPEEGRAATFMSSGDQSQPTDGVKVLYHDLFTNGIFYLDLGFDLHTLSPDLLPYVPLFGRALLEMGTATDDFVRLSQRINRDTGGIWRATRSGLIRGTRTASSRLFLRSKSMLHQVPHLLELLRDILLTVRLDNRDRFLQMVLESKARMEPAIIFNGSSFVDSRLSASDNEADWVDEQMGGLSQLFFVRRLAERVQTDWPSVLAALEAIRTTLINRAALIGNVTLDAANWTQVAPQLDAFLAELPLGDRPQVAWSVTAAPANEAFVIPGQINYVGKSLNLYQHGYQFHGSLGVIARSLNTGYLWDKVRVQGGAYGGYANFDRFSGVMNFLSYRDPNFLPTLDIYDATSRYLHGLDLSEDELTKTIIGTIGDIDAYRLPDAKGWFSLERYLWGESDEVRQTIREQVLTTTLKDFHAFGDALAAAASYGRVVVLGSQSAIDKANATRPGWLDVTKLGL